MIISIIFVHYGQNLARSLLARRSFESLYQSVKHLPCEIILVDNGGDVDDSRFFLEEVEKGKITHYLRNAYNIWFGKARNQAYSFAEGEYIVTVDNDLIYSNGWLEKCIHLLEIATNDKVLSTPMRILYCHKRYTMGEVVDTDGKKYPINTFTGSNCWVMNKDDMKTIGPFADGPLAGTDWCRRYAKIGYSVIVANEGLVIDEGHKRMKTYGFHRFLHENNKHNNVQIKKTLINGDEVIYCEGNV